MPFLYSGYYFQIIVAYLSTCHLKVVLVSIMPLNFPTRFVITFH